MNELLAIYSFIQTTLLGDNIPNANQQALRALIGMRVYAGVAPTKEVTTGKAPANPLIVISTVSSANVIVQDGTTAWVNAAIDVKIVGAGSLADLAPIDAVVFQLLQKTSGDVAGTVHIMECHQEAVLIPPPVVDGNVIYNQIVHTYRVRANRFD